MFWNGWEMTGQSHPKWHPPLNNTAGTLRSVCLLKEGKIKRNLSKTHCFSFCYCHFNCVKSEIFTVHSESKNKKIVMDFNRALIVLHSLIALIRDESQQRRKLVIFKTSTFLFIQLIFKQYLFVFVKLSLNCNFCIVCKKCMDWETGRSEEGDITTYSTSTYILYIV